MAVMHKRVTEIRRRSIFDTPTPLVARDLPGVFSAKTFNADLKVSKSCGRSVAPSAKRSSTS